MSSRTPRHRPYPDSNLVIVPIPGPFSIPVLPNTDPYPRRCFSSGLDRLHLRPHAPTVSASRHRNAPLKAYDASSNLPSGPRIPSHALRFIISWYLVRCICVVAYRSSRVRPGIPPASPAASLEPLSGVQRAVCFRVRHQGALPGTVIVAYLS